MAVQNKLYGLSQNFLQKVRGREVKKHTHREKHGEAFFKKKWKIKGGLSKLARICLHASQIGLQCSWGYICPLSQNFNLVNMINDKEGNKSENEMLL